MGTGREGERQSEVAITGDGRVSRGALTSGTIGLKAALALIQSVVAEVGKSPEIDSWWPVSTSSVKVEVTLLKERV